MKSVLRTRVLTGAQITFFSKSEKKLNFKSTFCSNDIRIHIVSSPLSSGNFRLRICSSSVRVSFHHVPEIDRKTTPKSIVRQNHSRNNTASVVSPPDIARLTTDPARQNHQLCRPPPSLPSISGHLTITLTQPFSIEYPPVSPSCLFSIGQLIRTF